MLQESYSFSIIGKGDKLDRVLKAVGVPHKKDNKEGKETYAFFDSVDTVYTWMSLARKYAYQYDIEIFKG